MFSTPNVITSLAMYSSDIGIAGTGMYTGKLFYRIPGEWLSTSILSFCVYSAVLIVRILAFATKYWNHAAISLNSCMRVPISSKFWSFLSLHNVS